MAFLDWKGNLAGTDIVTGTVAAARLPALDAITAPANALDMNSQKITDLADPTADQDAVTKKYLSDQGYVAQADIDAALQGLSPKEAVRLASTADVAGTTTGTTITTGATSLTMDGQAVINGDRVLLKDQDGNAAENGIYTVSGVGSDVVLTRATDFDDENAVVGAYVLVTDGTLEGKGYVVTSPDSNDSITIGMTDTAITWALFSAVDTDTNLTDSEVQVIVGAMVSGNTETGIAVTSGAGKLNFVVDHDAADNYLANEHIDWTGSSAGTIHSSNYTDTTYSNSSWDHDQLTNFVANEHIDWTGSSAGTIHSDNYTDTNTQLTQEQVEDYAAAIFTSASHSGCSVAYTDSAGTLAITTDITTASITSLAVTSLSGTTDEIDATASVGSVTLSLPDIKKVAVFNDGTDNFIDADVTIARSTMKQMYCFTATDDRTLTLPQVGGAYAPIGSRIEVKLLSVATDKKVSVAAHSSDKTDGSDQDIELDVAGEALNFTAVAATGDSTTTWIVS